MFSFAVEIQPYSYWRITYRENIEKKLQIQSKQIDDILWLI